MKMIDMSRDKHEYYGEIYSHFIQFSLNFKFIFKKLSYESKLLRDTQE